MGLMLQLPNIHYHLAALFHRFMSLPPAQVVGLFSGVDVHVNTRGWQQMLRDDAGSCTLLRIEFCKAKGDKLHEFLLLHFSHPTHQYARAVVVVDRAAKDCSRPSAIVSSSSPSQTPTEALDIVRVPRQGDNLANTLGPHGPHDKLCVLEYNPTESHSGSTALEPPSAIQISILLLVVTNHKPNYNLYEYNCYWYADMVFDACKKLFPGGREKCNRHADRGRCRFNLPMLDTHSLDDICNEYRAEWSRTLQRQGATQEIVANQEWERRFEEERRIREAAQQKVEEERRIRETVQRELEDERRARRELERQLQTVGQGTVLKNQ